jgi:hypothetical protein
MALSAMALVLKGIVYFGEHGDVTGPIVQEQLEQILGDGSLDGIGDLVTPFERFIDSGALDVIADGLIVLSALRAMDNFQKAEDLNEDARKIESQTWKLKSKCAELESAHQEIQRIKFEQSETAYQSYFSLQVANAYCRKIPV